MSNNPENNFNQELIAEMEKQLKQSNSKNTAYQYLNNICRFADVELKDDPYKSLFTSMNNKTQNKLIAIGLLRLLCHNEDFIWKSKYRVKIFDLFNETFPNIYRELGIEVSDDNHEKFRELKNYESVLIDKFKKLTRSFSSLENIIQNRSNFMKALNINSHKIIFDNYIEDFDLITDKIRNLFKITKNYLSSTRREKIDAFQECKKSFQTFFNKISSNKSYLVDYCIQKPINKIYKLVEDDFSNEDLNKPTQLDKKEPIMKYPFHIEGKDITIKLNIINKGPGFAFNTKIIIEDSDPGLKIIKDEINFGTLEPGTVRAEIEATVESVIDSSACIMGKLEWNNFDNKTCEKDFICELDKQNSNLNWDELKRKQPYSLEAVNNEKDLVGRDEVIGQLFSKLTDHDMQSSIIFGQKRVGKTSIAKTLQNKLAKKDNIITVYCSTGDFNKNNAEYFINDLGKFIVSEIEFSDILDGINIECGDFNKALSPLKIYLRKIKKIKKDIKFVFIIDEFDELPLELQKDASAKDTFLHNIRSLSNENYIGFVLVGGENMKIIQQSTDRLNKFFAYPVDYFNRQKYWSDFNDLVKKPVDGILEYTEDAVSNLFEYTEGNPFYTKLICMNLYKYLCETRNTFISEDETKRAITETINNMGVNNLNHFWLDGINEDDDSRINKIQKQRKIFLLAYANIKRKKHGNVNKNDLKNDEMIKNEVGIDNMIESFDNRSILIENNGSYRCKPKIFEEWLIEKGNSIITTKHFDEKAINELNDKEAEYYVKSSEILDITDKWPNYRGRNISPEDVRAWLEQFSNNYESRLMFTLLENLKFYGTNEVRSKFQDLHERIKKGRELFRKHGEQKEREILVSAYGDIGKSGPSYARDYGQANQIYHKNITSIDRIHKKIEDDDRIKLVIFVDDIIATGKTAKEAILNINSEYGQLLKERNIKVGIVTICAVQESVDKLNDLEKNVDFEYEFLSADVLNERDKCFSEESEFFSNNNEKQKAKEIALQYGRKLEKKQPLGYGDSELLVTFPDNCPNNTLPIFYKELKTNPKWRPLFKRG